MTLRPLFISTYPPSQCGLATFTEDLADAVDLISGGVVSSVAAIRDPRDPAERDRRVVHEIENDHPDAYRAAADVANEGPYDVVCLQHGGGLHPGAWGRRILGFLHNCRKPVVTTFHTLVSRPDAISQRLIRDVASRSRGIVVMTAFASRLLRETYLGEGPPVRVIPHGVPETLREQDVALKARAGLTGRRVICTSGLIGRGKGLECMIGAMPRVVAAYPDAVYLIVGATHPAVKGREGESYREELAERSEALGVGGHVRFVDRYLPLAELLAHLQASDVYVTPFLDKDQIVSGSLAYAMAAGRAVVSTPYPHAEEALADGRGTLVPFADSQALAGATLRLLADESFRAENRQRASEYSRPMYWPNVGRQYLELFEQVAGASERQRAHRHRAGLAPRRSPAPIDLRLDAR